MQGSEEAGKVVWYFCVFKNFPQFVVIHIVKGFSVVNEAEIDAFMDFCCFFYDPTYVGNLISGSSAFSKSSLNIWKFTVHILLKPDLENFEHYFARHRTTDWFQIDKGVHQGCILSPCLFNLYAEYIMRNAGLDGAHVGIKIAGRNISSLRYADDTIIMAESAATAAAKSLQSCPTLCDPIDGSPPGSPVPGILQARTLEWVAISFSNA